MNIKNEISFIYESVWDDGIVHAWFIGEPTIYCSLNEAKLAKVKT